MVNITAAGDVVKDRGLFFSEYRETWIRAAFLVFPYSFTQSTPEGKMINLLIKLGRQIMYNCNCIPSTLLWDFPAAENMYWSASTHDTVLALLGAWESCSLLGLGGKFSHLWGSALVQLFPQHPKPHSLDGFIKNVNIDLWLQLIDTELEIILFSSLQQGYTLKTTN